MENALSLIYYNLRCRNYQYVMRDAASVLDGSTNKNIKDDGKLKYWRACADGLGNSHQNAIRGLESMRRSYRYLEFAVICALIWFQQQADLIDEDDLRKLKADLKTARSCVQVEAALLAADFYNHVSDFESAFMCLNLPIFENVKNTNQTLDHGSLKMIQERCRVELWVHLRQFKSNPSTSLNSDLLRSECFKFEVDNADSIMAQATYHYFCNDCSLSLQLLGRLIARDDTFYPALIEICKLQFSLQQYRLAGESAQRVLKIIPGHMEVLKVCVIIQYYTKIFSQSEHEKLVIKLCHLLSEGKEQYTCVQCAKILYRLCSNDDKVTLESSLNLVSDALQMNSTDRDIQIEKAKILQRLGRYKEAIEEYESLLLMNVNYVEVSLRMVLCLILKGNSCDARDQLEFIALSSEKDKSKVFQPSFVWKLVNVYTAENSRGLKYAFMNILKDLSNSMQSDKNLRNDNIFDSTIHLDLECITTIIKYYLVKWPMGFHEIAGIEEQDEWTSITEKVIILLTYIIDRYHSSLHSWILLAKIYLQLNKMDDARNVMSKCLTLHPRSGLAHLYHAQIQLGTGDVTGVHQILERTISEDFGLKTHPLYYFVKGSLSLKEDLLDEAKSFLVAAIQCKEISDDGLPGSNYIVSLDDRLSCYIELGKTLLARDELNALEKVSIQAEKKFSGLSKSFHFTLFRSDILLKSNEVKKALHLFTNIHHTSPYFVAAQLERAKIHLDIEKDMESFLRCHRTLAENITKDQNSHLFTTLVDTYMKANLYNLALQCCHLILERTCSNEQIVHYIGKIMKRCHKYEDAIQLFEGFLQKVPKNIVLRLELISLYINTTQAEQARHHLFAVITEMSKKTHTHDIYEYLLLLVKFAKEFIGQGKFIESTELVLDIIKLYNMHMNIQSLKPVQVQEIKNQISDITLELLDFDSILHDTVFPLKLCKAVLKVSDRDKDVLTAWMNTLYHQQKYDDCQEVCDTLTTAHDLNDNVIIVSTKLSLVKSNFNNAYNIFKSSLKDYPRNYRIIYHFLSLLKRMNKIDDMKSLGESLYVRISEKLESNINISKEAELCYGCYQRLNNNFPLALESFNCARGDKQLHVGKEACKNMIEIYLRLDDYDFWITKTRTTRSETPDPTISIISSLKTLLQQYFAVGGEGNQIQLFNGYLKLLDSSHCNNMNEAFDVFNTVLKGREDFVPALLGVAIVFHQQENKTKLRSMLKRIAKLPYRAEYWKEFEWSYLLLSSSYLERENFDLALDLCKRCLFHNKSCVKAWETMGMIMERKYNDANAIQCFREVEKLNNQTTSLKTRARLATLFFKTKQFSAAIGNCTEMLKQQPEGSQITSILENCILSLRP